MIRDVFARFSNNQRPLKSTGVSGVFYPLPTGLVSPGVPDAMDLQAARDLGAGRVLKARFDITAGFVTSDTSQSLRFGVGVADDEGFLTRAVVIATSGLYNTTAGTYTTLVPGVAIEVVVPPLPDLTPVAKRRYLFLGLEIATSIALNSDLFSAGGVTAHLLSDTDNTSPAHLSSDGLGNVTYLSGFRT
jgi:hypothetical protein